MDNEYKRELLIHYGHVIRGKLCVLVIYLLASGCHSFLTELWLVKQQHTHLLLPSSNFSPACSYNIYKTSKYTWIVALHNRNCPIFLFHGFDVEKTVASPLSLILPICNCFIFSCDCEIPISARSSVGGKRKKKLKGYKKDKQAIWFCSPHAKKLRHRRSAPSSLVSQHLQELLNFDPCYETATAKILGSNHWHIYRISSYCVELCHERCGNIQIFQ